MLKRMQQELNTAILFTSCEPQQLRVVCDTVAVLDRDGCICEFGTANDVMKDAKHPVTKEIVKASPAIPAHIEAEMGGSLAGNFDKLATDGALTGAWLPL